MGRLESALAAGAIAAFLFLVVTVVLHWFGVDKPFWLGGILMLVGMTLGQLLRRRPDGGS